MSSLEVLKITGQIAGIGGLTVSVFLILFREILRKNIFPTLAKTQAHKLLLLITVLTWSVGIAGIAAWLYVNKEQGRSLNGDQRRVYSGRVVDGSTLEGVPKAKIVLDTDESSNTAYSDSEGSFRASIGASRSLNGRLRVEAVGYEIYERIIEISAQDQPADIRLTQKGLAFELGVAGPGPGATSQSELQANDISQPRPQSAPPGPADQVIAIRTDEPPTIDGNSDEEVWARSKPFIFAAHPQTNDSTTAAVRLLWDKQYLYAAFDIDDTQVEGSDATPFDGDSISIVLQNNRKIREYRHSLLEDRAGDAKSVYELKEGTTFNDRHDQDEGYFIEMRIPLFPAPVVGQEIPADLLSVDHDYNPRGPYNATRTVFSKISWDGDANVDTVEKKIKLEASPSPSQPPVPVPPASRLGTIGEETDDQDEAYDCLTTVTASRDLQARDPGESCWLKLEYGVATTIIFHEKIQITYQTATGGSVVHFYVADADESLTGVAAATIRPWRLVMSKRMGGYDGVRQMEINYHSGEGLCLLDRNNNLRPLTPACSRPKKVSSDLRSRFFEMIGILASTKPLWLIFVGIGVLSIGWIWYLRDQLARNTSTPSMNALRDENGEIPGDVVLVLQEKLNYLLKEQASASDAAKKFQLGKEIEEAEKMLKRATQ